MVRGNWAKNFFHRENSFFWNVCSYRPLRSLRKNLSICTLIVNINCVPIQYVPWHFSCSIKRENSSQDFFFAGKAAFFSKICFSNNLLGPNKSFYRFHSVCHISLWTLKICPLRFFTSNKRRKMGQKLLSSWKQLFLKCLFLSTPQVPKKLSGHLHSFCQHSLCTHTICSMTSFMFDKTRKHRPETLLHWKDCLCFRNFVFSTTI